MTRDPTMPRLMPPAVERALREVLAWRNAAVAPIAPERVVGGH